jgi:hypothetical protein
MMPYGPILSQPEKAMIYPILGVYPYIQGLIMGKLMSIR